MNLILTTQGSLVKCRVIGERDGKPIARGKRGKITSFSNASRKRLLELFATLTVKQFIFITLTYGQQYPDIETSKRHLKAFIMRLRRKYPKVSGVWRLEFQKRGAAHYHLLLTHLPFLPKEDLTTMWEEVIGLQYCNQKVDAYGVRQSTFTRIEVCKSKKKVMNYVAKYVAKKSDAASIGSGFNNTSYQHEAQPSDDASAAQPLSPGRFWGYIGKEFLPYAHLDTVEFAGNPKVFFQFRRAAKKFYNRLNTRKYDRGFTLFSNSIERWRRYFFQLALLPGNSLIGQMA